MMTVVTRVRLGVLVVLFTLVASHARAQSEGAFALGAGVTAPAPGDSSVHGNTTLGPLWRVGHDKNGWGWQWGLTWFSTGIDRVVGSSNTDLGELKVRPVMVGYGYSWVRGRTTFIADGLAGYAFTTIAMTSSASDAYRDRLGARSATATASNPFVVKPEVAFWYDLSKKVGLNVTAGYIVARPTVTVSSSAGDDARRVRADVFVVTAGVVYSIF